MFNNYNIIIDSILFDWDNTKNLTNIEKHGISFVDAVSVFDDEFAILFDDPDHSTYEERFLIIGYSAIGKICIVSHCYRNNGNIIRIISARKATKKEANYYYKFNRRGY